MSFSSPNSTAPDINVTPLIDVLLVLLIICMIITPLAPRGLDAAIPVPSEGQTLPPPENTVVLQLARGDSDQPSLKINQQAVSWGELHPKLAEIYKQRADHVMFVKGDREIDFSYIAEAIDIAKNSGVTRIGLIKE